MLKRNNKKTYTDKYLDKLPSEFSTMLGRHSAIMDLLEIIDKTEKEEAQELLNGMEGDWSEIDELEKKLRRN